MAIERNIEGDITLIAINRKHAKNAVDGATARALYNAFREFDADTTQSVAILYGLHGTLCSGADLKAFDNPLFESSPKDGGHGGNGVENTIGPMGPTRLILSKPVICCISGFAVAGGLELACWCDLRIMEEDAVVGVFCRTVRLPRLIGLSRAMDLILTGRGMTSQEALESGFANRVVPKGTSLEAARKLAQTLAAYPQVCMREDRMSVIEGHCLSIDEGLANEWRHGVASLKSGGARQGASRFAAGAGRHGSFEHARL